MPKALARKPWSKAELINLSELAVRAVLDLKLRGKRRAERGKIL